MDKTSSNEQFLELNEQRKYKSLCDVTLLVEDEQFHCHRIVLSTYSKYFTVMFQGDFVERTMDEIRLGNFNKTVFRAFLDLAYTGETRLFRMDNITAMLMMAGFLISELLEKAAVHFMKHSIHMSNILEYVELANSHALAFLSSYCVYFLCIHFREILQNRIFIQLPFNILRDVLAEVEVDEINYVRSLVRWLKCDAERWKYVEQLVKTIRFEDATEFSLSNVITGDKKFKKMFRKCFNECAIIDNTKRVLHFVQLHMNVQFDGSGPQILIDSEMFSYSRSFNKKKSNLLIPPTDNMPPNLNVTILNDHIYFWCGLNGKTENLQRSNFLRQNLYSLTTPWKEIKRQSEQPLQVMIGVNEKNKIYASRTPFFSPRTAGSPLLYCYDAVRDDWHFIMGQQNNKVWGQCLVSSNDGNVIYLCGGATGTCRLYKGHSDITIYDDRDRNQFQIVSQLVKGGQDIVTTIYNNSIYVIDRSFTLSGEYTKLFVQRYDINAGKTEMIMPIQYLGREYHPPAVSAATFFDKIWLLFEDGHVQCYHEGRNIWEPKQWRAFDYDRKDWIRHPLRKTIIV